MLALLALLLVPAAQAAAWTLRPIPAGSGTSTRCVMESERQPVRDGYQDGWAQIVVDDKSVRVTTSSELDPGDKDIGLVVDEGAFVAADEVTGLKTAVFTARYQLLIDEFKRGLRARAQLRFWPTWPKTGTHSAMFSLIGFTRTHAGMAECRTP
jgi:hypothetical protein